MIVIIIQAPLVGDTYGCVQQAQQAHAGQGRCASTRKGRIADLGELYEVLLVVVPVWRLLAEYFHVHEICERDIRARRGFLG